MIDCIPASWVIFDQSTLTLKTKFIPPPYTKVGIKKLHKIIEKCDEPNPRWPEYTISFLKGVKGADTYKEALHLIDDLLADEDYQFSSAEIDESESDDESSNKKKKQKTKEANVNLKPLPGLDGAINSPLAQETCETMTEMHIDDKEMKNDDTNDGKVDESANKDPNDVLQNSELGMNVEILPFTENLIENEQIRILSHTITTLTEEISQQKYELQEIKSEMATLNRNFGKVLDLLSNRVNRGDVQLNNAAPLSMSHQVLSQFSFPLDTKENFDKLCDHLKSSANLRELFRQHIDPYIDSKAPLCKVLNYVLRRLLHKNLASQFVLKKSKSKFLMIKTVFYSCLWDKFVDKNHKKELGEKLTLIKFDKAFGYLLTNAKKWPENYFDEFELDESMSGAGTVDQDTEEGN